MRTVLKNIACVLLVVLLAVAVIMIYKNNTEFLPYIIAALILTVPFIYDAKMTAVIFTWLAVFILSGLYTVFRYNPFNLTLKQQTLTLPYTIIAVSAALIPYFIIRKQRIKRRCTYRTSAKRVSISTEYKKNMDGAVYVDTETNEITVYYTEKYEYCYNGKTYSFTITKTSKENRSGWDSDSIGSKPPVIYIDIFINPDNPSEHYCGKRIGNGFFEAFICLVIIGFTLSVMQGLL